jgi:exopolyphosphatase/guanosine-5'-triphosphate,3'-diphosphate pyrophosphatase
MRAGCIDIGSNTTRLLVADRDGDGLREVHQERAFTRIGHGLQTGGAISPEKVAEVIAVVAAQLHTARELGAGAVCGVATAAIRTAANGPELLEAIETATGLRVRLLSGREEARLAFAGAAAMLDRPPVGALAVVDVGGGSSELVVGFPAEGVQWWTSVPLGSSSVTDRWLSGDPPDPAQLDAARAGVRDALGGLAPPRPATVVAVGGSATSLCRLAGLVLDGAALQRALSVLTSAPATEVAQRTGIDAERVRLMPAGLVVLEAFGALLGTVITVGRGGIREAVVLEAVAA